MWWQEVDVYTPMFNCYFAPEHYVGFGICTCVHLRGDKVNAGIWMTCRTSNKGAIVMEQTIFFLQFSLCLTLCGFCEMFFKFPCDLSSHYEMYSNQTKN